jgi:hypothetical protein
VTQRRRFAAASTPSGSSTTTGRRHACSHLERWRRRREGRAEDRGDTARRGDLRVPAGRCPDIRESGETPRMEARRPLAVEPPFGLVGQRSAYGTETGSARYCAFDPSPCLSVLRVRAGRYSTKGRSLGAARSETDHPSRRSREGKGVGMRRGAHSRSQHSLPPQLRDQAATREAPHHQPLLRVVDAHILYRALEAASDEATGNHTEDRKVRIRATSETGHC